MSWLSQALIIRHRTTRSIFVGIIAFSLGAAGTAAAVRGFTSSDNLFHACANSVGSVRVLADGDTCKSSEVGFVFPSQAYVDAVSEAWKQGDATLQTNLDNETAARKQADADEAAARRQGDADTLAAANAYTDAHAGGRPALQILSTRVSNAFPLDPLTGGTITASVSCTGGKVLIGGGASSNNSNVVLYQSFPASTLQWTASARAVVPVGAFTAGLTADVICMGYS